MRSIVRDRARVLSATLTLLVLVIVLAGCRPGGVPSPTPTATPEVAGQRLAVVSNLDMGGGPGNITDVWSLGNYAYLGTFDEPRCGTDITGVHVVDIADPAKPFKAGFIPSPQGARVGDVQVAHIETAAFKGDVLVFALEPCDGQDGAPPPDTDGISIYDVTDPLQPKLLAQSFLDTPVHNTFVIQSGETALALVVSDARFIGSVDRDFYLVDISDPANPSVLSLTGAPDWSLGDQGLGAVRIAGLHDVWAKRFPASLEAGHLPGTTVYDGKTIAYLSYWDAGLVILDITDPTHPVFLGHSTYLDPDPVTGQPPEGNSHSAVPTEDGALVFMGDEDFSTSRATLVAGTGESRLEFRTVELGFTRPVLEMEGSKVSGPTTFVGSACGLEPVVPPVGTPEAGEVSVALVERGGCRADEKVWNIANAGYGAAVVFNRAEDPPRLSRLSGDRALVSIPAAMVSRETGLILLGTEVREGQAVSLPEPGTPAARLTVSAAFDGWGYGRILDVRDPAHIVEVGQVVIRQTMAKPVPPGAHSIHNLILQGRRAYIAWYSDGIRVVDFSDPAKPKEIASFVDEDRGSDFWGVHLHRHSNGKTYILGSDRSTGLWVFETP